MTKRKRKSKLIIRQGASRAWFIYDDNAPILGSHDKDLIEKVKSFLQKERGKRDE